MICNVKRVCTDIGAAIILLSLISCNGWFDVHPYDVNLDGKEKINEKQIAEIERRFPSCRPRAGKARNAPGKARGRAGLDAGRAHCRNEGGAPVEIRRRGAEHLPNRGKGHERISYRQARGSRARFI